MKSKWYELKEKAVKLRQKGISIGKIESLLNIPRSTLSGWFKNIELTKKQKAKLTANWKNALVKARKKAVLWHHNQKRIRVQEAKNSAIKTLGEINIDDINVLELSLAFLYLGEGTKKSPHTSLGSSDPMILKFFLSAVEKIYNLDTKKLRYELYLRADQKPNKIKNFWAKELKVPVENFKQVNIDKRTKGTKTYPSYKGVCNVQCGHVAIQRKLMNLANLFSQKIIDKN